MQKITRISITNYKAYYGCTVFNNQDGANILIYGENGSGKSSLFNALKYFLKSAKIISTFEKNIYREDNDDGLIQIEFTDVDSQNKVNHTVSSNTDRNTTHLEQFLKDASDSFGYLDYKRVLEFYLTEEEIPELFNLVVIKLLGRYVPPGLSGSIRNTWDRIHSGIFKSKSRATKIHKRAVALMADFDIILSNQLNELEQVVNGFLRSYFTNMGIIIRFNYKPLRLIYAKNKRNWKIERGLTISVINTFINANPIIARYKNNINEAKLSAIAVCIYLASLKCMPKVDLNLLILDDVFIGIDMGNRLPILNLIDKEFNDFQIILTTYDRGWFEMVKRRYCIESTHNWTSFELYEGNETLPTGDVIVKPIIIKGENDYQKAWMYFHDHSKINYHAAGNCLRKSFEALFKQLPQFILIDKGKDPIETYKLSSILKVTNRFFTQCANFGVLYKKANDSILEVRRLLHPLLHPLSHNTPDLETYKGELVVLFQTYEILKDIINGLALNTNVTCYMEKGDLLRLTINGKSGWCAYYELELYENIYRYAEYLSETTMHMVLMYGVDSKGAKMGPHRITKNSRDFKKMVYSSMDDAVHKISDFLLNDETKKDLIILPDIKDMFEKKDMSEDKWIPL